jgi:hypothetical protein
MQIKYKKKTFDLWCDLGLLLFRTKRNKAQAHSKAKLIMKKKKKTITINNNKKSLLLYYYKKRKMIKLEKNENE